MKMPTLSSNAGHAVLAICLAMSLPAAVLSADRVPMQPAIIDVDDSANGTSVQATVNQVIRITVKDDIPDGVWSNRSGDEDTVARYFSIDGEAVRFEFPGPAFRGMNEDPWFDLRLSLPSLHRIPVRRKPMPYNPTFNSDGNSGIGQAVFTYRAVKSGQSAIHLQFHDQSRRVAGGDTLRRYTLRIEVRPSGIPVEPIPDAHDEVLRKLGPVRTVPAPWAAAMEYGSKLSLVREADKQGKKTLSAWFEGKLDAAGDIDARGPLSMTALHYVTAKQQSPEIMLCIVSELLRRGAKADAEDALGWTPLSFALSNHWFMESIVTRDEVTEVFAMLLDAKADPRKAGRKLTIFGDDRPAKSPLAMVQHRLEAVAENIRRTNVRLVDIRSQPLPIINPPLELVAEFDRDEGKVAQEDDHDSEWYARHGVGGVDDVPGFALIKQESLDGFEDEETPEEVREEAVEALVDSLETLQARQLAFITLLKLFEGAGINRKPNF